MEARVDVTIGTREGLEAVRALPLTDRRRIGIQLKVDTGVSRQGLRCDRIEQSEGALREVAGSIRGVWTHLADGADAGAATGQLERFDQIVFVAARPGSRS